MSHPPKSTIFAPAARWTSFSGVFCSFSVSIFGRSDGGNRDRVVPGGSGDRYLFSGIPGRCFGIAQNPCAIACLECIDRVFTNGALGGARGSNALITMNDSSERPDRLGRKADTDTDADTHRAEDEEADEPFHRIPIVALSRPQFAQALLTLPGSWNLLPQRGQGHRSYQFCRPSQAMTAATNKAKIGRASC